MLLGLDELLPSFVLLDRIPLDPKMLGMSSGKVLVPGKVLQAFFLPHPKPWEERGKFSFFRLSSDSGNVSSLFPTRSTKTWIWDCTKSWKSRKTHGWHQKEFVKAEDVPDCPPGEIQAGM